VRLAPLDPPLYRATGDVTIRGETRALTTPVRLAFEEGRARASGRLEIDRTDFGLGVGPVSALVTVGERVTVAFDLVAEARTGE